MDIGTLKELLRTKMWTTVDIGIVSVSGVPRILEWEGSRCGRRPPSGVGYPPPH